MMLSGHEGSAFIARDAVFATVMIVLNGVIGLCISVDVKLTTNGSVVRRPGSLNVLGIFEKTTLFGIGYETVM